MQKYNVPVCAGVVTYNPNIQLLEENLMSLFAQVDEVFVYDNGSNNAKDIGYLKLKYQFSIEYSEINVGISKALNELCKKAKRKGYEWIITMDQDSICDSHMVVSLIKYAVDGKNGIIAPRVEFWSNGELIHTTKDVIDETINIKACITSGSLTNLRAWSHVEGFDEWMFIDHVDNEFCTNLRLHGYAIIRVNSAILYQRAGEMNYLSFPFGKKLMLPYYSTLRNYYICRNTVYYLRKYRKYISFRYELCTFIYSQIVKILFEKNRMDSIKSTWKGVIDGFKKRNF